MKTSSKEDTACLIVVNGICTAQEREDTGNSKVGRGKGPKKRSALSKTDLNGLTNTAYEALKKSRPGCDSEFNKNAYNQINQKVDK